MTYQQFSRALMLSFSVLVGAYVFHLTCMAIRSPIVRDKWYMKPWNLAIMAFLVGFMFDTRGITKRIGYRLIRIKPGDPATL